MHRDHIAVSVGLSIFDQANEQHTARRPSNEGPDAHARRDDALAVGAAARAHAAAAYRVPTQCRLSAATSRRTRQSTATARGCCAAAGRAREGAAAVHHEVPAAPTASTGAGTSAKNGHSHGHAAAAAPSSSTAAAAAATAAACAAEKVLLQKGSASPGPAAPGEDDTLWAGIGLDWDRPSAPLHGAAPRAASDRIRRPCCTSGTQGGAPAGCGLPARKRRRRHHRGVRARRGGWGQHACADTAWHPTW